MRGTGGLKVFISSMDATCDECWENLGRGAWINLVDGKGGSETNYDELLARWYDPASRDCGELHYRNGWCERWTKVLNMSSRKQ
jgi:hypothetical protein